MSQFATFVTLVLVATLCGTTTAIDCLTCFAWEGVPGSYEDCRTNPGVGYSETCVRGSASTLLIDPRTNTILNRTAVDPLDTRKKGDLICAKLAGTDSANKAVILRACAEALVDGNMNGACEVFNTAQTIPGIGTIKAGAKAFYCTSNNCNSGAVSNDCKSGSQPAVTSSALGVGFAVAAVLFKLVKFV